MTPFPSLLFVAELPIVENLESSGTVMVVAKLLIIVAVSVLVNWVARKVIARVLRGVIHRTKTKRDDVLLDSGAITRMSHVLPALVVHFMAPLFFEEGAILDGIKTAVSVYLIFITLFVFDGILNAIHALVLKSSRAQGLPIKGFIQATKLIANLMGLVFVVSVLFGKTPIYIISGLGALTAVLMLIFRDAILGFVAGIQISVNNMVRPGDWIEMPANNANGDVMDVSLTTVKVRNFDQTITSIPAYDLISKSFINWRGMSESGGRRIKRALRIDMRSIRFVDATLQADLERIQLLRPFLADRLKEIDQWNSKNEVDGEMAVNGRRLTNIGCFRAYCEAYLRNDERIRKDMTFLFRQLAPDGQGLPLEIYVFTDTTDWELYETIQADIFDHLIAAIPRFDLAVYQEPSGSDLEDGFSKIAKQEVG
ncbi:MAG: mechanosensitive ion channel family protein [Verrucomicrobiota bacterium]